MKGFFATALHEGGFYLPPEMARRCVFLCNLLFINLWLRFLFVLNFRRLIGFGFLLILGFICSEGLRWVCLSRLPGIFGR